jgi:hypothetical protein
MLKRYPARLALMAIVVAMCAACSSDGSPTEPGGGGIGTAPTDFNGQYLGSSKVTACSADPIFSGFCDDVPAGTVLPMTLSLTQSANNVTGTVTLADLHGTFTGTVSSGVLNATAVMEDLEGEGVTTVKVTLENWSTTITGSTLTGGFKVVFRVPSFSGNATLTATIQQLIR